MEMDSHSLFFTFLKGKRLFFSKIEAIYNDFERSFGSELTDSQTCLDDNMFTTDELLRKYYAALNIKYEKKSKEVPRDHTHKVEKNDFTLTKYLFLNWMWFLPFSIQLRLKLNAEAVDEHYDYKQSPEYSEMRFTLQCLVIYLYLGIFGTFFYASILLDEVWLNNIGLFLEITVPSYVLLLLFLSKYEVLPPRMANYGMQALSLTCHFIYASLCGGVRAPHTPQLSIILPLYASIANVKTSFVVGGVSAVMICLFAYFPFFQVSYIKPEYVVFCYFREQLVNIFVVFFGIFVNYFRLQGKEKDMRHLLVLALEADRSKKFFLASTAHELRTPLHHVSLLNHLIQKKLQECAPKELMLKKDANVLLDFTEHAKNATNLLLTLVDDALDMSKLQAGEVTTKMEKVDLSGVLQDTVEMFKQKSKEQDIDFRLISEKGTENIFVSADTVRVIQVMTNLLGNAFKFTEKKGKIEVRISEKQWTDMVNYKEETIVELDDMKGNEPLLCISVTDSGIGLRKESVQSIFLPFNQAEGGATTRKYGGSGLGLTICKKLTELIGAGLTVKSKLGTGSSFSLWFKIESRGCADNKLEVNTRVRRSKSSDNLNVPSVIRRSRSNSSICPLSTLEPSICMESASSATCKIVVNNDFNSDYLNDLNSRSIRKENNRRHFLDFYCHNKNIGKGKSYYHVNRNPVTVSPDVSDLTNDGYCIAKSRSHGCSPLPDLTENSSQKKKKRKSKKDHKKGSNKGDIDLSMIHVMSCDDNVISLRLLSSLLKSFDVTVSSTSTSGQKVIDNYKTFLEETNGCKCNTNNTCHAVVAATDNGDSTSGNIYDGQDSLGFTNADVGTLANISEIEGEGMVNEVHVLLLDLYMPEMDGFETAKLIRTMEAQYLEECHPKLFIIALSASSSTEDLHKAINECGMNLFINKPFDSETLKNIFVDLKSGSLTAS